jgi:hypothetical protein
MVVRLEGIQLLLDDVVTNNGINSATIISWQVTILEEASFLVKGNDPTTTHIG